jgi:hypothetical protein
MRPIPHRDIALGTNVAQLAVNADQLLMDVREVLLPTEAAPDVSHLLVTSRHSVVPTPNPSPSSTAETKSST